MHILDNCKRKHGRSAAIEQALRRRRPDLDVQRFSLNSQPRTPFPIDNHPTFIFGAFSFEDEPDAEEQGIINNYSASRYREIDFVGKHLKPCFSHVASPKDCSKISWIIAAYLQDTITLRVTENERTFFISVPHGATGFHFWDVRNQMSKIIGIPQYMLSGTILIQKKQIKPPEELPKMNFDNTFRAALQEAYKVATGWPARKPTKSESEEDAFESFSILLNQSIILQHNKLSPHITLLEKWQENKFSWFKASSRNKCQCASNGLCENLAILYVAERESDLPFCVTRREAENLTATLADIFLTAYQPIAVSFYCRDCSKSLHPDWVVADFFPCEFETCTPFHPEYCSCYKKNRSWKRSVIAVLTASKLNTKAQRESTLPAMNERSRR